MTLEDRATEGPKVEAFWTCIVAGDGLIAGGTRFSPTTSYISKSHVHLYKSLGFSGKVIEPSRQAEFISRMSSDTVI